MSSRGQNSVPDDGVSARTQLAQDVVRPNRQHQPDTGKVASTVREPQIVERTHQANANLAD
jgi:hypothetical protein